MCLCVIYLFANFSVSFCGSATFRNGKKQKQKQNKPPKTKLFSLQMSVPLNLRKHFYNRKGLKILPLFKDSLQIFCFINS